MRRALLFFGLFFGLLLVWVGSPEALTLSEIRTQIRVNVHDTASTASLQRYSDSTLTALINEAQRDVVNQTWCLETSTAIPITAGTTYYSLPTNTLAISQARYRTSTGTVTNLSEVGRRVFLQGSPDFERQSATGIPTQYFVQYSTSGGTALQVGIVPSARSSGGSLLFDYYHQATDLSGDSEVPFGGYRLLYPYHYSIVYRVSARIRLMEGFADAQSYAQMYASEVSAIVNRAGSKPNYNPSFSGGKP
jgi:hypothetical protein